MSQSGLIPSQQTRPNTTQEYYLRKGEDVIAPLTIVSSGGTASINLVNSANPSTTYALFNASATGQGLVAGDLQIYGYGTTGAREILQARSNGSAIELGDSTVVGGSAISVNGTLGLSRVNDPVYNPATAITSIVASANGNIVYNNTYSFTAGNYAIQLSGEAVTSAINTRLRIYLAGPTPASTVVNFAVASIAGDTNMTEFSLSTNIFNIPASGTYRIFVVSTGANWTSTEWGMNLIEF